MKKYLLPLITILLLCLTTALSATPRYVKEGGAGTQDGSSWANASGDLQQMINESTYGDQIWVAGGTYYPTRRADALNTVTLNDRDNAFVLKHYVYLYGGFAGNESSLDERNIAIHANKSILSGNLGDPDSAADNAYHVVIGAGTAAVELNAFTIEGGNANGSGDITVISTVVPRAHGGGLYLSGVSGRFNYLKISNNHASSFGGGMYSVGCGVSVLNLTNVELSENTATSGGAILNLNCSARMENVTIAKNSVSWAGGGIYNSGASFPGIWNSIVWGNTATHGPNLYAEASSGENSSCSLIEGVDNTDNAGGLDGTDPSVSPQFVDFDNANFALRNTSSAINAGCSFFVSALDLAGKPRVYNGEAEYDYIDLGAYEFQGEPDGPDNHFITTWKTDNPGTSDSNTITIPVSNDESYNYDVSWENDGVWENGFTGEATHSYDNPGTYTVAIRGVYPRIYLNNTGDKEKILSVEQWGTTKWTSMEWAFTGCENVVINASDTPNLSNVTSMLRMFNSAHSVNQDISNWDVSNVEDFSSMFAYTPFNQDISAWDVGSATNMWGMFSNATDFDQDMCVALV